MSALAALALSACARPAPALPEANLALAGNTVQLSDAERSAECAMLAKHVAKLRNEMKTIEEVIRGQRQSDQVAGYLSSILFPPAALAIDQQKARKAELDKRQAAIDADLARERMLSCPTSALAPGP